MESAVFGIKPIQSLTEPRDRNTFFGIESSRQAPGSFLRKLCCGHLKVGIRDKEIFCWLVRERSIQSRIRSVPRAVRGSYPHHKEVQMENRRTILTPGFLFLLVTLLVSSVLRAD